MIDKVVSLFGYTGNNEVVLTFLPIFSCILLIIFGVEFLRLIYNLVFSIFGKGGKK